METVTLNIEGDSIRVLTTDGKRVKGWGNVPLPPGLVKDGLITAPSQVGSLIETLLVEKRLSRKRVIVSLSGMRSLPRLLTLPRTARSLVPEAIRHESEREMPVSLNELYLCWRDLGVNGSGRRFFVVGVPRTLLDAEVQALIHAGIKAHALDLKPMALTRAVNRKEAVIINLEQDNSDIVLVVDGIPVIMRTLILRGEGITQEDKVRQTAAEVSRTVEFYHSSHPEHPISSATPAFLTGALAKDGTLAHLARAAISNPIEEMEAVIECPGELSVAEYAVNIGLALKAAAPRGARRAVAFPALDIAIVPDGQRARRPLMRSWLYVLTAIVAVALLFPAYQGKLVGDTRVAGHELELSTLRQQLQDVHQTLDPVNRIEIEASRLREEREVILDSSGSFADGLEVVLAALPAGVGLTSITMTGDAITLDGVATSRWSAVDYAASLEETRLFSTVHIASSTMTDGGTGTRDTTFSLIAKR